MYLSMSLFISLLLWCLLPLIQDDDMLFHCIMFIKRYIKMDQASVCQHNRITSPWSRLVILNVYGGDWDLWVQGSGIDTIK